MSKRIVPEVHPVIIVMVIVGMMVAAVGARTFLLMDVGDTTSTYDPNTSPYPIDPNLVTGKLLGTVRQRAGLDRVAKFAYGEPDGDEVTVALASAPAGMTITHDPNNMSYQLSWQPDAEGQYQVIVSVTDVPKAGLPQTNMGTIMWFVEPENRSPYLLACGNIELLD